jgi:hypothetical protein
MLTLPNVQTNRLKDLSVPAAGQGHVAEDRCHASHRTPCTSRSSLHGSHSLLQTVHTQTDYNNYNNWLWTGSLAFNLRQSDASLQFTYHIRNKSWAHHASYLTVLLVSTIYSTVLSIRTTCINFNLQWPDVTQQTNMPVSGQKSITHTLLTHLYGLRNHSHCTLLSYETMQTLKWLQTLQRNLLPPSSGQTTYSTSYLPTKQHEHTGVVWLQRNLLYPSSLLHHEEWGSRFPLPIYQDCENLQLHLQHQAWSNHHKSSHNALAFNLHICGSVRGSP